MKCKFCNEEMPERGNFCPICGGDNSVQAEEILIDPDGLIIESDEEMDEANQLFEEAEETAEEEFEEPAGPSPALKKARLVSAFTGCVAALAILGIVLFAGISGNFSEDGKGWDVSKLFSWIIPRENNVHYKDSYTVSDKKAQSKRENVVATVPGAELTNGQLQIYYWSQVYEFLNQNSYYLSYYGLDYTSPLDQQAAYSGTGTWQQYFLDAALNMWRSNVSFAMMAKKNGFTMDAETQKEVDGIRASLEADAKKKGYASADAMLQASMGPGCNMDDYIAYMENYYLGYSYFASIYDSFKPTMEDINAYFDANQEALKAESITKDGSYTVDVRHILIKIEELKTDAQAEGETEGETEEKIDGYTKAAWDACEAKANEILDQWLAGEKTEESFAELAKQHSADGNASEGGIYTGVKKGQMLETFDNWCFDVVRKEGDYGIVRTMHGYHIMYFVDSEETWITQTRSKIINEEAQKVVTQALEECPMEVIYKKIVLGEVSLG